MPKYRVNGDIYNIPEEKVSAFEKRYPNATVDIYDNDGAEYSLPVSEKVNFQKQFKNWSYTAPAAPSAPSAEKIDSVEQPGPVMPNPDSERNGQDYSLGWKATGSQVVGKADTVPAPQKTVKRPEVEQSQDNEVRTYLEAANRKQVAGLSNDIDVKLNNALTRLNDAGVNEWNEVKKGGLLSKIGYIVSQNSGNPDVPSVRTNPLKPENRQIVSEVNNLEAAKNAMTNARELIEEADKSVNEGNFGGFVKGSLRGFGDKLFDVRTWDMGASDSKDNVALYNALKKFDKGEKLTESEQMLLDAKSVELATNAYFGSYIGRGYKAGMVTAQSLPFMIEMAVNPASATGTSVQSRLAKYALDRFSKKGVSRAATILGTKAAGMVGRAVGDAAGAAIMAGTTGAMRVAGDAVDRINGSVETDVDENGRTIFAGHEKGESTGKAIAKAFTSNAIENHSEMLGEYFEPALGRLTKLGKSGMNKIGLGKVTKFIDEVHATDAAKLIDDFQEHTKWNGTIGEYAEEVVGNIENAILVGDSTLDSSDDTGVFNLDQNIDTFLGVALMGGVFSTIRTASWRTPKYRARKEMEKARDEAKKKFGDQAWQDIEDRLAEAGDEGMSSVLSEVIIGERNPEREKAILDYAKSIKIYEGTLKGDEKHRELSSPEMTDLESSYENGYTLATPQEVHDAKIMFEYQQARLQQALGMSSIDIETLMLGNEMGKLTEEQKSVALDYLNAEATFDGVIDRVRDDIDNRISSVNAAIDASTNSDTGKLQPARLVDDRAVHIISGIVRLTPDGTMVDIHNSEDYIIIRDDKTGKIESVSPSQIVGVDAEIDPESEKKAAESQIRGQIGQQKADIIDGVLQFNPGDVYTLTNEQGQSFTVQIAADEQGIVDNGDGTINVILNEDIDANTGLPRISQMPKEQIENMAEATNMARLQQYEQQKLDVDARQYEEDSTGRTPENPFKINDRISFNDVGSGSVKHGIVESELTDDGKYEIAIENDGSIESVSYLSPEDLSNMHAQLVQSVEEQEAPEIKQNPVEIKQNPVEIEQPEQPQVSAFERIPKDEQGNPIYEQAETPDLAWDAIVEQTDGDEAMAQTVADGMVADKETALKKVEKAKSKGGATIAEKIAAEKERKAAIEEAKANLAVWKQIAQTARRRKDAEESEKRRIAEEQAAIRKAEEEKLRAEREEAERIKREALNGVPDISDDTPQDARARGYRRVSGHKVDRQEPIPHLQGNDIAVKFSDDVIVPGRVAVIDAETLQPSHIQGTRNPAHFIDESQPKERTDDASVLSARKIARNIRPEEITSSITAYTGAPTTNVRGEVIQGNNRSDALRLIWEGDKEQSAIYKQYLMDHAADFGLNADEISAMNHPVLVNMLDVDDATAITLGQFVAQDTESGGTERIKPKNAVQKMGADMRTFADMLLASSDDETSFAGLVDRNGDEVLAWMNRRGFITPTQYKSAFDSKGSITAEAKNDLKGIMYQSIFTGGNIRLEEMFNAMPAKAQRAILATAFRDNESPNTERMVKEIQNSIRAYNALSQGEDFANAKNWKEARLAVESWKMQYAMDDVTGESYLPAEKFSNFALHLATMYKGESQSLIQSTFNHLYDLIQGTQEETLFEKPDNTPRTLAQAILETLNFEYDGQQRSNVLAGDSTASQEREQGSTGTPAAGERVEGREQPADNTGGTENESGSGEVREKIAEEGSKVNTNPSDAQKEAGNYRMGHVKIDGMDVTIENPKGSIRKGRDADGKEWQSEMHNDYGYIRGTKAVDNDHIDIFLSDDPGHGNVYVIDQVDPKTGKFDESKVMYGFSSEQEARDAYLSNYEEGWKGLGKITEVTKEEFKKWIDSSTRKTKPFSEYRSVKPLDGNAQNKIIVEVFREWNGKLRKKYRSSPKFRDLDNAISVAKYQVDEGNVKPDAQKNFEKAVQLIPELYFGSGDIQFSIGKQNHKATTSSGVKDFAEKYSVSQEAVEDYANGMRLGTGSGCGYALQSIRRDFRLANSTLKFAEFSHEYAKLKQELFDKFGDYDKLKAQQLAEADAKRDAMEAARKRIEEEQQRKKAEYEARIARYKGMSLDELDSEYFKALENKDEVSARDIVDEVARRNGYTDVASDYQGVGAWAAPTRPGGYTDEERRASLETDSPDLSLEDISLGYTLQPDDIFDHPERYMQSDSTSKEAARAIKATLNALKKGNKDAKIKVFRAVPLSVKEGRLRNGDWVTPSRAYADMHGNHRLDGEYRVIEEEVPAKDLWWDGNDVREWGYDDGTARRYANVENNTKLNDVITRDDAGNIIPPSRRFDLGKADERYQISGRKAVNESSEETRIAYEAVKEQLDRIGIPVELLSDQAMREMAINANALETVSSQNEYQQTVISSASGAKIINNLDNLAKSLENEPKTKEKTFLGALAKALDAKKHGSNSQYATFEAKNGIVVTIRLANHNAATSTFDNHEENDGISIVVSARENNGITNDGKAHVTEFYYDAIKLRKADGKPLVDIVKSIKQSLYSGEYKDTTGLAQREEVNAKDVPEFMTVYHGSGAKFDRFDHSHMGEGEGNQAFGWGTYVTEVEGIGRTYAKAAAAKYDGNQPKRNLYTVEIPEDNGDNYLDWSKKINDIGEDFLTGIDNKLYNEEGWRRVESGGLTKFTKGEKTIVLNPNATVADIYEELSVGLESPKSASEFLNGLGYVGISYPAEYMSGGRSDGARNYVIFNENDAKITGRIEFLREPDGTVYGATVGGKIYLNQEHLNPNTPIHEYTHLWFSALKDANPELYKSGVELMKQLPIWEEVKTDPNYANLSGDDAIASECLSRLVGDKGADKLTELAKKAMVRGDIIGTANRISLIEDFKDWLKKFWTWVKDSFAPWTKEEASRVSVDDIQNMVLSDLAKGVNPLANAREESELKKTNDKFNEQLETFTIETADRYYFNLGRPSPVLLSAGIENKPIRLHGSKVAKKVRKHGFQATELRDLPKAIAHPIAVFDNLGREGNRSILTELKTDNGNVLVSIDLGRGTEVDFNIVSSAFGKNSKGILGWINGGKMKFVDKEKALNYLHLSAPIAEASDNAELLSAAKIVKEFENPSDKERKPEFQFIGEKGAAHMDKVEEATIRLDNLSIARKMEDADKDAKTIKLATGWERGADGKWRYEISDANIKDTIDLGKGISEKRFEEDMLWNSGRLGDVIDAPEIFEAYPQLKDIHIETDSIVNDMPSNGEFNANSNRITIHADRLKYLNSILNHEIQHAIQHIEGFATGGTPEHVEKEFDAAKTEWRARAYAHELEETAKELGGEYNLAEVENALGKEYKELGMEDLLPDKETRIKGANYFARGYADRSMDEAIKRFRLDESTRSDFNSYVEYMHIAGEVEARNVSARLGMTPDERRRTLALETEDVSREDQIILNDAFIGNSHYEEEPEIDRIVREAKENGTYMKAPNGKPTNLNERQWAQVRTRAFKKWFGDWEKAAEESPSTAKTNSSKIVDENGEPKVVYHGSPYRFFRFDKTKLGQSTGADSAKEGFFFTDNKELAELFSRYSLESLPVSDVEQLVKDRLLNMSENELNDAYEVYRNDSPDYLDYADETDSPNDRDYLEIRGFLLDGVSEEEAKREYIQDSIESKIEGGYFSDMEEVEEELSSIGIEFGNNEQVFLNIESPLVDEVERDYFHNGEDVSPMTPVLQEAKRMGRDGVVFTGIVESGQKGAANQYVAFEPNQIKSATDNVGTFDGEQDDIRYRDSNRMDAEYMSAIESGDMRKAGRMVEAAFRKAFPGSKVKNVVYHGVAVSEDGKQFPYNSIREGHFTDDEGFAEYYAGTDGYVYKVFLDIESPLEQDFRGQNSDFARNAEGNDVSTRTFARQARESNGKYDGAIITNVDEYGDGIEADGVGNYDGSVTDYIPVSADQIYSAEPVVYDDNGQVIPLSRRFENGNPDIRYKHDETGNGNRTSQDIEAAATKLAESLGEKVRLVRDVNEIENQNKKVQENQRKSKGWFNTDTREIVVVLPNATGIEDVQATILHEAVGHKGLRELVGDDRFDDFLDKVYAAATKATRLEIVSLARRNHWDFRLATEEYIAGLAENGFAGRENRTLFEKIKDFFRDMLSRAKIALGVNIGDNELRYMLWRTYQMRTSRGILAKAEDISMQQSMNVGNFREDNSSPVSFLKQMQDNAETLVPRQLTKEIWDNEIKGKVFSTPIGVVKLGENQYEKNIKKGRELEFGMLIPTIERPDAIFEEDAPETGAERQTKYVFVKSFVENGVKKINYASVSVRKDGMEVVASSHYLRDKQMLNKIEKERMLWNRFASGSELSAQGGSTAQSNALSHDANLLKGVKKTNSDEEILSGDDSRLRFRTSANVGSSNKARDIYEEKTRVIDKNGRKSDTANLMRRLKEAYVDSMQSLKYLQDAISEETGKPVEDFENAYLAENSMSSKNKAQTDIYLNRFFNPIKDAIRDLQKEGAEYGDIVRYLMAKHGLERNGVFSKRDAEKDGGVWDGSVRRDYSGLTELTRSETDTVAPRIDEITSRAEDIVRKFEMDHDTDVLWEKINDATKDTLRTSYITGMLTKDNYEMVRSMFRYYIPLRGWSENTASAVYDYLSDARPKTSSIVKAATGRTTISDDPIATIAYMGQSAIIQGNRNMMKQKLLNLALNHKTGLLTVNRQWEVQDPVTGEWITRNPVIPVDATPEEVADIVSQFETDMKAAEKNGTARISRGKLDTGKHITAYEGQEHVVKVKRGGIEYCIYLNGNPRAAQAVNGMTNPDAVDSWLIRKARVIKNFMARMFTSQNPAFIISNLSRDVIFAGTAVFAKENSKYTALYTKNIARALAKGQLIGLVHRFETGRLDDSKDIDRYFGEFIRNGGETGFTQLNTVDDFKRDLNRFAKEMKQGQVMKVSSKVWNGIWDGVEFMNRCAEDATRFSVYMTSRQMGRSVERSISDAKEITVNFNRKGSGGFGARVMNFAYIFFNAAIQALANAGKIFYEHPVKSAVALSTFSAAGFLAPLLAQAIISAFGGDDDAYWDLPEWVRRNNFVFYVPWSDNKFLIIPISQELRPFYALGEVAMSVLMGKEDVLEGLRSVGGSFMDLLPVDFMGNGNNLAVSLTPTVAQPFAQLVANSDYFGKPIYRRNDYNRLDPAWTKAYKGTSSMLINASKWLNEVTGGDDVKRGWIDPVNNPAVIEHLFESYLGGVGKTINKTAKTISMIWNPEMRDIRNVPIVSTFVQESDDERVAGSQLNREYVKAMEEFRETEHTISGYKRKARMGSMEYADKLSDFMNTPEFKKYSKMKGYASSIAKLRTALKKTEELNGDVMDAEYLQEMLRELKQQMLEELKED